ncbi:MAG: hypothetical protein M1840_005231 [Geoglossum simile]|nr:MAG: hypothetical protein M1840_005231 [Geoglossum simile]
MTLPLSAEAELTPPQQLGKMALSERGARLADPSPKGHNSKSQTKKILLVLQLADRLLPPAASMGNPADLKPYIPWEWSVTPEADATCPPPKAILGTFAVVNIIVGVLSIICGHRRVTKVLTCKLFGHKNSTSWKWMWIVIVGLQLGANALIAKIIKLTPGYDQGFRTWQLTLFFTARPRVSWIFGLPFSHAANKCTERSSRNRSWRHDEVEYLHLGGQQAVGAEKDYAWRSFALSQFIAEIMLQFITAYTMGTTVAFAAQRGYYILGSDDPLRHKGHMMYSAALYWLCGQSLLLLVGGLATIYALIYEEGSSRKMHKIMTIVGVTMLPLSWAATWLFWAGYVRLAGDLYCPPKLILHGIVWIFFSTIGVMLGTGTG